MQTICNITILCFIRLPATMPFEHLLTNMHISRSCCPNTSQAMQAKSCCFQRTEVCLLLKYSVLSLITFGLLQMYYHILKWFSRRSYYINMNFFCLDSVSRATPAPYLDSQGVFLFSVTVWPQRLKLTSPQWATAPYVQINIYLSLLPPATCALKQPFLFTPIQSQC